MQNIENTQPPIPQVNELQPSPVEVGAGNPSHLHSIGRRVGTAVMAGIIAPGIISPVTHHFESPAPTEVSTEQIGSETDVAISSAIASGVDNKYQQEFQTDTEDTGVTRSQVHEFLVENKAFFEDPAQIESVIITGLASAEDEKTEDQQLVEPSEQNQVLAGQRGLLATHAIIEEAKTLFGVDISDKVQLGAREDMLSAEELSQVQEMSTQFGYKSVESMIDQYNHEPTKSPPAVGELLDNLLAARRGAIIEIVEKNQAVDGLKSNPENNIKQNLKNTTTFERYEGYIPKEQAPIVIPEKTVTPKLNDNRQSVPWSVVAKDQTRGRSERPTRIIDPRRSSRFNVQTSNGRRGYSSMSQSRKGRGSLRPIPNRAR